MPAAPQNRTVEEWLAEIFGYDVDPHRTRDGVRIEPVESETGRSPPPRECPERPNKRYLKD